MMQIGSFPFYLYAGMYDPITRKIAEVIGGVVISVE